jgi:hypothetical protein
MQIVAAALLTVGEAGRGVGAILTGQIALHGSADASDASSFGRLKYQLVLKIYIKRRN